MPPVSDESIWFSKLNTLYERKCLLLKIKDHCNSESDIHNQILLALEKIDNNLILILKRFNQ